MQLYDRPKSRLPVSIGTSLALESIFMGSNPPYDPERVIPQKIQLSDYKTMWFNVETLIRNIATSVERSVYFECAIGHVLDILKEEIDIIRSVFAVEGHGICKPEFYVCSYRSFRSEYKGRVEFRESSTDIQKSFDLKATKVMERLIHQDHDVRNLDSTIKPRKPDENSSLILTHYAYDLTNYDHFHKLDLLESHTGVLKSKASWNTKYASYGKESLTHLPFLRNLLMVFGDKNQIHPQKHNVRKTVLDISIKNKWTPYTTLDKVRTSFKNANLHPIDLDFLLSL